MNTFYLGVDVSKGYADFVIINRDKKPVVENFQLDDTSQGHSCLYRILNKFNQDHLDAALNAAVESTGGYENNWFKFLRNSQSSLNLKVAHLNPLGVTHNSKASLKRNVTDKISAQNVAEYMIAHPEKVSYHHFDPMASLRKQWVFIKMLTKQSTQLFNQLESLLYNGNPEILIYCKDGLPQWVLKLLSRYPTALRLSKARATSVAAIPYISPVRAKELIASAKTSVASTSDPVTEQVICATAKQILHLQKTIAAQTKITAKDCSIPEVELLKTFLGISDYSAIGLMLEIQTVQRFPSAKKLSSFFGLHPEYKISGDRVGAFRMSKKGRREPRRILFMVAMSAVVSNPHIRSIYEQHVEKGMKRKAAIGVCMHKILRIIYGMLKHNRAYNPKIDQQNREKMAHTTGEKVAGNRSRRYQNFDSKAPVSRRQKMKRQEREQSQNVNDVKYGIMPPLPVYN